MAHAAHLAAVLLMPGKRPFNANAIGAPPDTAGLK